MTQQKDPESQTETCPFCLSTNTRATGSGHSEGAGRNYSEKLAITWQCLNPECKNYFDQGGGIMITTYEIWHRATRFDFGIKKNLGIYIESTDPTRKHESYRLSNGGLVEAFGRFASSLSEYSQEEAQEEMKFFGKVFVLDGGVEVRSFPDFRSFWETIYTAGL